MLVPATPRIRQICFLRLNAVGLTFVPRVTFIFFFLFIYSFFFLSIFFSSLFLFFLRTLTRSFFPNDNRRRDALCLTVQSNMPVPFDAYAVCRFDDPSRRNWKLERVSSDTSVAVPKIIFYWSLAI